MTDSILKYFAYAHLPEPFQEVSKLFNDLVELMEKELTDMAEKSAGFRKTSRSKRLFCGS